MKTKLFLFTLILVLSMPMAIGQNSEKGKISFAILGGINFQNLTGKDISGDKLENDMIMGYHAGLNIQMPVAGEIYFQPGLIFSTKGARKITGPFTSTYNISYIELPLNMVYKGRLGNGYVLLGFGPYIAFAIGGNVTTVTGDVEVKTDIEFQNKVELTDPLLSTYLKAFDAGGNIFAGYEMAGGIFFHLNAQLGMLKINPENEWISNDESSVKNTGFGLSLGYRF